MSYLVETVSGNKVNIIDPNPDTILLDDIAWGLSRINRFCGATVTEVPYNNAQHSLFVADLCRRADEADFYDECYLFALLHDSSEYVTGDFPSPLKRVPEIRTAIKKIENHLLSVIYIKFMGRLPTEHEEIFIKRCDVHAQQVEAHAYMHSRGSDWAFDEKPSLIDLQSFPPPETAIISYKKFMEAFRKNESFT